MTNSERPFNYSWTRANTNTRPQSPTKRSPKPSRDIFTTPCSKRKNGRKEAKAPDGRVLHLSSERSLILKANRSKRRPLVGIRLNLFVALAPYERAIETVKQAAADRSAQSEGDLRRPPLLTSRIEAERQAVDEPRTVTVITPPSTTKATVSAVTRHTDVFS